MSYTHLTPSERGQLHALYREGKSQTYMADCLGRHRSTISRELRRNGRGNRYNAPRAQRQYHQRREWCRPAQKQTHRMLWRYVIDKLIEGWPPEAIAGRLPLEFLDDATMRISYETIYRTLYSDKRCHYLIKYLPQARPKRRKRGQGKTSRGPSIPNRVGIEQRPAIVEERSRFGDWEGDTIVGAGQQGYLVTLVDRTSRLLVCRKVDTKHADLVAQTVIHALEEMPISWVKTITFDNGSEFAGHEKMAEALPTSIYFAAPYSSYQRGTNENTNGLIRRYLPKGTPFGGLTDQQVRQIEEDLNNRPRKILGYQTPYEVFLKQREEHRVALRA